MDVSDIIGSKKHTQYKLLIIPILINQGKNASSMLKLDLPKIQCIICSSCDEGKKNLY